MVASLVRRFGDIDIAEEAAGEALLLAVEKWPVDGVPPNPGGWLTTTAGNKAIDRIRRESHRDSQAPTGRHDRRPRTPRADRTRLRRPAAADLHVLPPRPRARGAGGAHPAPARWPDRRRDRGGVLRPRDDDGAAADPRQAEDQGREHPLPGPRAGRPRDRVSAVLAVVYLVFNEGYLSTSGEEPVRADLTAEAIRLGRVLRELMPDTPEVAGLLALMLLIEARRSGPGRRRRAGAAARPGPRRLGPRADRRGPRAGARVPRARTGPGSTSCWPRSTPSTPTPPPSRTPTGRRSPRSTPSCTPCPRRRWSRSTGRSPSPSSTARRWPWPRWTGWTSRTLPRLARDPGRPAPPARSQRRGAGGVRRGDRGDRQRGRARLPRPEAWHAGAVIGRRDRPPPAGQLAAGRRHRPPWPGSAGLGRTGRAVPGARHPRLPGHRSALPDAGRRRHRRPGVGVAVAARRAGHGAAAGRRRPCPRHRWRRGPGVAVAPARRHPRAGPRRHRLAARHAGALVVAAHLGPAPGGVLRLPPRRGARGLRRARPLRR